MAQKQVDVDFNVLMKEIKKYIKQTPNLALIKKAYVFAEAKHSEQVRKSGEPYISHLIQVAYVLAGLRVGPKTIAAGLLHDVVEDCGVSKEDFIAEFDEEIYRLVEGVTKIGNIEFKDEKEYLAANHRKILIAMAKDIRVIIIKLCDRLHNMRTLKYMSEDKQKKIAQETLEVYAPIAHRLGISEIKNELEDLSFYYINREKYYEIARQVELRRAERDAQVNHMIKQIKELLQKNNIHFKIFGRSKHLYSIYNKMLIKHKKFEEILDLLAIRIITDSDLNCYEVLGHIHANFVPVPGRLKDYIAMPKSNMYQSLHTTIINEEGNIFEVQIRTQHMDDIAERGVAAHWLYKEGKYNAEQEQKEIEEKLSLFRDIVSISEDDDDGDDQLFMDTLQKDFFDTNVYVMSPKGRVIDLPNGSTPIDFAYRIHTEVGHSTIGATVNGALVPLNTVLKTGDVVNLRTSKQSPGPSEDWLKFVKTSHARNKIRSFITKKEIENRSPTIEKGFTMFKDELNRRQLDPEWINNKKLEPIYSQYNLRDYDDFMFAIGNKSIPLSNVMEKISKRRVSLLSTLNINNIFASKVEQQKKSISRSGIKVAGADSIMISLAGCCSPVLGDEIVGFITKGHGVKVHRKDCPNVKKEKSRLIDVEWDYGQTTNLYEVIIFIESNDRNFLLNDIITVLSQTKAQLIGVNSQLNDDKITVSTNIRILVNDTEHLRNIVANLKKIDGTLRVERIIQ
ncbi:MAG: bifunctional (p)ppGpp synthetase/guanosine-3',5'-bis(diphosphate) 3'-pyrophosphohydrolase [Erysipelotrichaceae bacterium]|nr:bifunctional (p)ppGpp synthetase/guanosine-3',5'-bis(diphosphate) 3'-pyrophosphohydrolase [Erysipelotrichaceae bacterium]MDD3924358.1 bifunctional (p)ppGpp synthetase/guanosine-3',5'-bis(diphosphate) 3'-pyrophosphohydrolase [Erysipelotrichaceae bacterium]MDD4642940.1 bifunctional (p)ppGpp synthetase/guanosine-3',5'-bis(diphosphate) 3'-pyrophosphohydrolase [Erysipelotrichaceae bacterium]